MISPEIPVSVFCPPSSANTNGKNRFTCSYECGLSKTLHLGQPPRVKIRGTKEYAGVVELADTYDLGAVTSGKGFSIPAVIANQSADWCGNPFFKDRFTCFYKSWIKRNAPPRVLPRVKTGEYAGMMELADMQDLGSCAAMRWGSNPHARTKLDTID